MYRELIILFAVAAISACSSSAQSSSESNSPVASSTPITKPSEPMKKGTFESNLPDGFVKPTDEAGRVLYREYGAVFLTKAVAPKVVFFKDEAAVGAFQAAAPSLTETVGGIAITLQTPAMKALSSAIAEANEAGLKITPRGADSAKRSYADTVGLWASRVDPGLEHWAKQGKITEADVQRIKSLSPFEQVPEIFKLEAKGIFFAKDLSKSIIYSVAPPGSSQHLSMLALDVTEHGDEKIRAIMAKNGWYQTVVSDLPHFTFLGTAEAELSGRGLKKVTNGGRVFWVPDI